jgi:hypothetical protein
MELHPKCRKNAGKWGKEGYEITPVEFVEEGWAEMKIKGISIKFSKKHSKKLTPSLTSIFSETSQSILLSFLFPPQRLKVPFSLVFVWLDRY